jgi:ATP-dependent DNA helicase DinG
MSWMDFEERVAEALPTYEPRAQQRLFALGIEDSLAAGATLLAQGGCGIGKSFAGLIPAIDYSLKTGVPVIVSTATKSLQSQYIHTDVPFLLKNSGRRFTAAVVKGRKNYICAAKLAERKPGELAHLVQLREELANPEHSGDVGDLTTPVSAIEQAKITTSSDECPGKRDCPFGEQCFAEFAKERARDANLVIVNHAALIADLKIKREGGHGILPEAGAVLIDESHELNSYATDALGAEFTQRGVQNLEGQVTNLLGQITQREVGALHGATDKLFAHLGGMLGRKERTAEFGDAQMLAAEYVLAPFYQAVVDLAKAVKVFAPSGEGDGKARHQRLKKQVNSLLKKIGDVIMATSDDLVRWVEQDDKRGVVLKYAPLHVGPFLKEMIWDQCPAVLMSATLAIGDDFSFVAQQHGIEEYRQVDAGSPFDFHRQARVFVPQNCDPKDTAAWSMQLRIIALEVIKAAEGRTLLLFSSNKSMKALHAAVSEQIEDLGYRVLIQGEGTNKAIAEAFKADKTSVLFGLKSFATGFDVQGDALVVDFIDKMPFPVPTDVIFKARCDALAKRLGDQWAPFNKLSVPMMALDLLQAAGRLIRTRTDEGLIVIADSRLLTKPYGRKILSALPPAQRVDTLGEAVDYLKGLSARRG